MLEIMRNVKNESAHISVRKPARINTGVIILLTALLALQCLMPGITLAQPGVPHVPPDAHPAIHNTGFTHVGRDGNRYTPLKATLPETKPLDIRLAEKPLWVVGMGNIWAVVHSDGTARAFDLSDGNAVEVDIILDGVTSGGPPVLTRDEQGRPLLLGSGPTSPMPLARPMPNNMPDNIDNIMEAQIKDGKFFIHGKATHISPLPDTRLLSDGLGGILFLTGPTESYTHGVLGDKVEATGFGILSAKGGKFSFYEAPVSAGVIEGTSAIWADMDGDGEREVVLTLSTPEEGSRLALFSETVKLLAQSDPIGRGFRWRHQIAVAPFALDGGMEIASVRTPHIGGTVEFHALKGDALVLTAEISGFSSHAMGSRNLDMAASGDLDSDGAVELLVPTDNMKKLVGLRRTPKGVERAWTLKLPGSLTTNIAVTEFNGKAAVGVGTDKMVLRLWLP